MSTATLTQEFKTVKNDLSFPNSIIPQKMNLRIRVLHAIDYPEIAHECHLKHTKVLEEFGLSKEIDSSKSKWWENPCSYLFIVEDIDTGEIGSSMRLDIIDESHSIPLEGAIKKVSPDIVSRVHKYNHILGELCGLWVDKKFSERKLALHLLRSVIAISSKLRIKHLVAMPPQHTKYFFDSMGFQVVEDIGNKGEVYYPNEKYISTVMEIEDTFYLPTLPEDEKDFIIWLRSHPKQIYNEECKNRETNLEYDLRIM